MDGFPMPVAHGARSCTPGWVADMARIGQGGNDRYGYGVRMMMGINPTGGATGAFWGRFFENGHDTHVFTLTPVPVTPAA